MGVPVSKMEESIEDHYSGFLEDGPDLVGGSFPAYPCGKSWDEASGKTGSGKKFYHDVISGADFTAQPYRVAIIIPVNHYCMAVWKSMRFHQSWGMGLEASSRPVRSRRRGGNSLLDCMGLRPCGKSLCLVRVER